MARYPILIKIFNLFVYVGLLGANVYSGLNDDPPYGDKHTTYISPAPFVFGVWGLIHFLLGGFVIYQFFGSSGAQDLIIDGINWHFVSLTLWNSLWLYLWQNDHAILAWFAILITASQISYVYSILKRNRGEGTSTLNELIWVHAPFSLYHAWIVVIGVISTFAAFTKEKVEDDKPNVLTQILVVLGLLFLEGTAVSYVTKLKGDIVGAMVIAWALIGISVEQQDVPAIFWTSVVLGAFTSLHIIWAIINRFRRGSSDETAPLLG